MSQQPYSLDAILKEQSETQGKIASFQARRPETINPNAYAAYNAASAVLEERIVELRTKPNHERNLFDDLDFLLGG